MQSFKKYWNFLDFFLERFQFLFYFVELLGNIIDFEILENFLVDLLLYNLKSFEVLKGFWTVNSLN